MQFPKITLPARLHLWKKQEAATEPAAPFGHHPGEKPKTPAWQKKLENINPRWVVAGAIFLFFLRTIGYYCYLTFYEIGRLETLKATQEQVLVQKKQELTKLKQDQWYLRYKATEKLMELDTTINWRESIIYLIGLYDIMKALGSNQNRLTFSDFQINSDRIIVRGTVPTMGEIYKEKWLLERLENFEFIEHIRIPFYNEESGVFSFVLDAKIKQYDRIKPAS